MVERKWSGLTALAALGYIAWILPLSLARQQNFETHFDLAIFDQALWLLSQGREPFVTVRGLHILGNHFSPTLYLLTPLYWLGDDVRALLVLQTLAQAVGVFPLYALARERLRSGRAAFLVGLAYLGNPQLQRMNVTDFEPSCLATPLLLGALYRLNKAGWPFYACLLLALGCKQNVGLAVAGLGLCLVIQGARRRGLATLALGIVGTGVGVLAVEPFNGGQSSCHLALYSHLGPDPVHIMESLLHPATWWSALGDPQRAAYLGRLLYPLAFLPLACPLRLLPAVPVALLNALSWKENLFSAFYYYDAAILPFLFWAALGALERLQEPRQIWGARLLAGVSVVSGVGVMGAWLSRTQPLPEGWNGRVAAQLRRHIPPDASVCAPSHLLPQLSHRPRLWMFPNPFQTACYGNSYSSILDMQGELPMRSDFGAGTEKPQFVVLLTDRWHWPLSDLGYAQAIQRLRRDPDYRIVVDEEGLLLFSLGTSPK